MTHEEAIAEREAIRKARQDIEDATEALRKREFVFRGLCPHTNVEFYSEYEDSGYVCEVCGRESRKKFGGSK